MKSIVMLALVDLKRLTMAIQVDTPMLQERLETRGSGLQLMTKTIRKQKSSEKLSERAREAALVARKRRKPRESS
jgi:hypothetical protein